MIEHMSARKLCVGTPRGHLRGCKRFAAFLKRSPETATLWWHDREDHSQQLSPKRVFTQPGSWASGRSAAGGESMFAFAKDRTSGGRSEKLAMAPWR